jgi:hypothetical protein|nr:MAG TPA: upper collar protein [Caudoviricetes sp.]
MGRRKRTNFEDSAATNTLTYMQYLRRLMELSMSMFAWKNLPNTVDPRYIELRLFETGSVVFFKDDVLGELCLDCIQQGNFDVYGNPITRRAYSCYNNYQKVLNDKDSVIIWNNYLRTNSVTDIQLYAKRLWDLDRSVDVNAKAQKTPLLIQCNEKQRMSMKNLYMQYDGNTPVIFADNNIDINGVKVVSTQAPYVADKLYQLKNQIWNEALTYLGISNLNINKQERLITDEVSSSQGSTISSRYSRLECRKQAVEKINEMFGLNIEVDYRKDYQDIDLDMPSDDTMGGDASE